MVSLSRREQEKLQALAENDPRIAAELKKLSQIQARLSDAAARVSAQSRRDDTREKIIIGTILIDHLLSAESGRERMNSLLSNTITKQSDRAFLRSRGWEITENNNQFPQ